MSISDFKKSQKKYKIRKYKKKYKESKLLEAFFILVFVFVWGYNTKIIPTYALCVISLCILTAILYRSLAQVNKKRKYLNLSQEQIDVLSGKNFEQYLQIHFKELGYRVKATPDTNDYGADLLLTKGSERIVVQAKRYSGRVGNHAIQEVLGALHYYNCNKAMVVTNSFFTKNAINMAQKCNVELWDRNRLRKELINR